MVKLSDFVIDFLVQKGITDIFLVSGGGIMHLLDSVGRNKKISYIANHHEQASAICAESWARVKNHISACLVTTGPGGTNAITGVVCAWVDSIPMIVLSGQVRRSIMANYSKLRQLAPQEINIVDIVKPITKYAKTVMQSEKIKYELERAFYFALSDRPGPVWLDFPLDVQGAIIDEENLKSFEPPKIKSDKDERCKKVKKTIEMLEEAERPILICGFGIRLAHAEEIFEAFIDKVGIPIIVHYNGMDLVPENHPLLIGKFGPVGQRRGNFALQNADLILSLGASLSLSSIGFDYKNFAPKAKKIMVNIDKGELEKATLSLDLSICMNVKDFMEEFLTQTKKENFKISKKWLSACENWKKNYPTIIPEFFKDKKHVNSYVFFNRLSDLLTSEDIIVTGNALDAVSLYQAFKVKKGQRAFTNANFGPMGWDLPAAIGACVANRRRRTICVAGDGSIQMNIQELQTISYYKLPIKIFVFNNKGYESIRNTQNTFFAGRFVGCDENSGVSNPNFAKLAEANNLRYEKIVNNEEIEKKIKEVLIKDDPVLCEVNISYSQKRMPRVSSFRRKDGTIESRSLHDMWPFLPRKEVWENMHMFDE